MNTRHNSLQIRYASNSRELRNGLAFVSKHYEKAFGVVPSPPDHLLVAYRGESVVGTIGINVWHEEKGLRLASLYQFEYTAIDFPIDLPRTVEFARWACESSGVACALLHAATCFSLTLEKRYVWCEHSPAVNRVCQKYGIVFCPVTNASRDSTRIENYHQAFYDSIDARLYLFRLKQAKPALKRYLEK